MRRKVVVNGIVKWVGEEPDWRKENEKKARRVRAEEARLKRIKEEEELANKIAEEREQIKKDLERGIKKHSYKYISVRNTSQRDKNWDMLVKLANWKAEGTSILEMARIVGYDSKSIHRILRSLEELSGFTLKETIKGKSYITNVKELNKAAEMDMKRKKNAPKKGTLRRTN